MTQLAPEYEMEERSGFERFGHLILSTWRPHLGWPIFLLCLWIAILPALAIDVHEWVQVRRISTGLKMTGPLAIVLFWAVMGWRRPWPWFYAPSNGQRRFVRVLRFLVFLLFFVVSGILVLSQLFLRWLPSPAEWWQTAFSSQWSQLFAQSSGDFLRFFSRYALWWQGIQTGGASQDDLVFAGLAGALLWGMGLLVAWLAWREHSGFVVGLTPLWLSGLLLIYAPSGRMVMAMALGLTILLQLLLDQHRLSERWTRRQYDFSQGIVGERYLNAISLLLLVLTVAFLMPSVSIDPVAARYYEWLQPYEDRLEDVSDRLFPDMEGSGGRFGRGVGGGMPNEFLLNAGSELGDDEVMRVRPSDAAADGPPGESPPPPGHYMRSATFASYDGLGWGNRLREERQSVPANDRWTTIEWQGRKTLVQSVVLSVYSNVLYAAPEPVETTEDHTARVRADGDLVALTARTSSYSVVSSIPAVSDEIMAVAGGWSEERPLPEAYAVHLALPATVTDRTRQLALDLTDGLESPYEKAQAIEAYLRTYEYDLTVPEPPPDVTDVADYFLFDLQRGYCDYYATAFVVLARAAGLPARFATGYAVGTWDAYNNVWRITEAEAHSWPEMLFPDYGWIPFEPTAGRPTLERIGLPQAFTGQNRPMEVPEIEPIEGPGIDWNWQMLVWLLPLALVAWGIVKLIGGWRARRQDPWTALLQWGQRAGRPISPGETALEYGGELADFVMDHQVSEPDTGRYVSREVMRLSEDVVDARYGPEDLRQSAVERAVDRWARLRVYLRRLRLK